jgi:hypothetical protein
VTNNKALRVIAVVLTATLTCACRRDHPLPKAVSCEAVNSLGLGQTRAEVEALLGPPVWAHREQHTPQNGVRADLLGYYGVTETEDESYRFRDFLQVYYLDGRLVNIYATRDQPYEGGFQLAYRLDGAGREIGPAFDKVFQCGADFKKPADE